MRSTPESNRDAHQRHLRAGRQSESYATFAITKCVADRRPVLARSDTARFIFSSLDHLRQTGQIKLLAFCVMPDHYHALAVLVGKSLLSDMMKSIGKFSARRINQVLQTRGELWQEGFHDHRCRDVDDAIDRLTYIENNPVRAGLVPTPDEWPYSSACPENIHLLDRSWYAENC